MASLGLVHNEHHHKVINLMRTSKVIVVVLVVVLVVVDDAANKFSQLTMGLFVASVRRRIRHALPETMEWGNSPEPSPVICCQATLSGLLSLHSPTPLSLLHSSHVCQRCDA